MDALKHIRSIVALPFTVLVVVPAIISYLTGIDMGWGLPTPLILLTVAGGALLIALGLTLIAASIRLFVRFGEGTLAPWDETHKLVVRGVYRHVRNPMHSGVFLTLYGEGVLLGSVPILVFVTAVFVLHLFYIPLSEERGLERRFGEPYRVYKQNVPRWIPRLTPWDSSDLDGGRD